MAAADVARARVRTQLSRTIDRPADVVRSMLAVQAQDYRAALWAIALRTPGATEADVERAQEERTIARTWPMRGTLHFLAADDLRWMVALLAPRAVAKAAARHRQLGLDDAVFAKARRILEKALARGPLTRPEIFAELERHGIATAEQRGIHVLARLAMDRVLCLAAHRGKQPTFALLDAWLPPARELGRDLDRDEALGELARRYFASHGPATVHDLAWWSGLPLGIARRALEIARPAAWQDDLYGGEPADRRATVFLLPPFDELSVAYRDRSAILDPEHAERTRHGIMSPTIVVDGRIVGSWSRAAKKHAVGLDLDLFEPISTTARRALAREAERYRAFLGAPELELRWR